MVRTATIRLVLLIAAARDYNLSSVDITQAYLQANLQGDLYMRPPPDVYPFDSQKRPLVCKLKRSLHGLKQAGREWAILFASFLMGWGLVRRHHAAAQNHGNVQQSVATRAPSVRGTRRGQPPAASARRPPRRLVPNNQRKVRAGNCHRPCTLAGPNHRRVWHRRMRGESYDILSTDIRRPACGSRGTHARTSARIRVACPHDPPTTSSEPYLRRTDERESGER